MLPAYRDYFQDQLRQLVGLGFPSAPGLPQALLANLSPRWRVDGVYFLLASANAMIVQPYTRVAADRPVEATPLWGLLHEDFQRIATRAEQVAEQRGRPYVSATSVTIALGQLADNLATTSLQIWGPEEGEGFPPGQP